MSAVGHLVDAVSDLIRSVEGAVSSVIHRDTPAKRGPGRPKGSKNKRGPGRPKGSKNKRGPGRPKGSKNKRGPGRPKGSKNKPGPGRPKGSTTRRGPGRPKAARRPGERGPGKNNPRLKSALKSYWANMTPAQRAERVRKMQAGRKKNKSRR